MFTLQTILVATDFSPSAQSALDYALGLASACGGRVLLLHVYEIPVYGFPDGTLIATADMASKIAEAAQQALRDAVHSKQDSGVSLTSILRQGSIPEEVQAVAEEHHVDLIVIGTHGRKGIARALLGSSAEKILRSVTRPLLVLHGPQSV